MICKYLLQSLATGWLIARMKYGKAGWQKRGNPSRQGHLVGSSFSRTQALTFGLEAFSWFKDNPRSPPLLKSFHKEYPSFQLTSKSTCTPLPPPVSFASPFLCPHSPSSSHISISTFLYSTLAIASAYLQFSFHPVPRRVSLFCIFTESCVTDKARVALDRSFSLRECASSSRILDRLALAYSLSSTRNCSAIGQF